MLVDIFFQTEYMVPYAPFIWVYIGVFGISIIVAYIWHRISIKRIALHTPARFTLHIIPPILPNIHDHDFVYKGLKYTEYMARKLYDPNHTWAHTSKDIHQYCDNPHILAVWNTLETSLYSGETLSQEARAQILDDISIAFTPNT